MAGTSFTFLTVDGRGRPTAPGSRTSIRSRCMMGVNVRQDSRRSKRKARNAQTRDPAARNYNELAITSPLTSHSPDISACGPLVRSVQLQSHALGPGLSSSALKSVMRYNSLIDASYPLEKYLEIPDVYGNRMTDNLKLLDANPTLLDSIFLATNAVDDLSSGQMLSDRSQKLLCTILSSLNNSLHHVTTQQSHSTPLIILILLFAAEAFQDFDAVATHLDGLRRLFDLRHTKPAPQDSKLLFKIQQFDLRMTLATGRPLIFPYDYSDLSGSLRLSSQISAGIVPLMVTDLTLLDCHQTLQKLAHQANQCLISKERNSLSWTKFQSQISTIQVQLINLEGMHLSGMEGALRLGMLAFLSTFSQVPVQKPHLPVFISQLERSYLFMQEKGELYKGFTIWLLLMGFLSTVDTSSYVSCLVWRDIIDINLSWDNARSMFGEFPWIKSLHHEAAERIFYNLQGQRSRMKAAAVQ